jgi:TRAP-type uncharacterized transport system substrate-binding protein
MLGRLIALVIVSALLVCAGVGVFFVWKSYPWLFFANQKLRIATTPIDERGEIFLTSFKQEIASERARIQLSLVENPNIWASARAFKDQKVDAALVRADDPAVTGGKKVLVLRTVYVALLVPASTAIDAISKLKGKKIGVLTDELGIDPMAKAVLDFYRFDEKQVARLRLSDLADSLLHRQLAALLVTGPTGPGPITDAIEVFRKLTKRPPKFLDLVEAPSITDRFPVYDEAEIGVGAFSGSPVVPSESATTISTSMLLVAQASLSNHAAGELTRVVLATKARVAAILPEVGHIVAPSTDKDQLLPTHPGTVAFLEGEQTNMLDDFMNWIFLGSMLTGALGSLAAWLNKVKGRRKGDGLDDEATAVRFP